MARRRNPLADRLARLEAAARVGMWHFTLDDGSTASLPAVTVLDVMGDALTYAAADPVAEPPPISRELRLLARVADGSETSVLGRTVVQLARHIVEEAENGENGAQGAAQ
ncbi:hypothetical protein [Streptomyces tubercidicus]|uniref:hypothetical protein n=1 Tax=Streptomyces tubercidicus TaxID=47759 RepID=UPI002E15717B|nr:hypothetical protein OG761_21480 [Streptomyces tubercidicus]